MVSVTFFPNSRFEFLSNMFNQCLVYAPILSFDLVEALVPNYACTTTNKKICLCIYIYIYIYINMCMCLYTIYYVYVIVQFCAHRSMKCYHSPMTISI